MTQPLGDTAQDRIFREARTHSNWLDKDVPEMLIRNVYDLAKWGPTSANCSPARFMFVGSEEGKERLKPFLMEGNVEQSMKAAWTVIIAHDLDFPEFIPELYPHNPGAKDWFKDPQARAETAFRNGSLQGAYLMIAARALGLDCGPMSGFDKNGVDREFFKGNTDTENWSSNFLCNISYGDMENVYDRSPRLAFEKACRVV